MPTSLLLLLLAASSTSPAPSVSPSPVGDATVILFLVDNSASLPPLDPEEKRVAALEKMFTFLQGQPYRLILFGGRKEVFVDDASKYNNRGQWTDFYFAFEKAKEIAATYPPKTTFRMVLLTDGIFDPGPGDWDDMGVPAGADLKTHVLGRVTKLLEEMGIPLYVILVGEPRRDGAAAGDRELTPGIILDMVKTANGAAASATAQTLAAFFKDDGLLLKKFVFRVEPHEGLKKIEPAVRRIVSPPRPGVEVQFLTVLVLPLSLFLFLLLGILVRSFPGPGDVEMVEMSYGMPVHVAADKLHKVEGGGWARAGLSLVADAREANASLTYQAPSLDLMGVGLDTDGLDSLTQKLLPLGVEDLRRELESYSDNGTKEEKIYALNLDYMSKNLEPKEAERVLTTTAGERRRIPALDFLRAKTHLITNVELRRKLTDPRVQMTSYGKDGERKDLVVGATARIGRYGFLVKEVAKGGRKDVKLTLYYSRVPSLLGLKSILPDAFQRVFRLRRSHQRLVA